MIIDETAIKVAELLSRIDELEKELAKKQSIIDQWQIEDYFNVNYPKGSR